MENLATSLGLECKTRDPLSVALENSFLAFEESLNGASCSLLHSKRKMALAALRVEWPTTTNEEWRYTNLKEIAGRSYSFVRSGSQISAVSQSEIAEFIAPEAQSLLVFIDGAFSEELSRIGAPSAGAVQSVRIGRLLDTGIGTKNGNIWPSVSELYGSIAPVKNCLVAALNCATVQDGLVVIADADADAGTVQLLSVSTSAAAGKIVASRVLVSAGQGSAVKIIETHVGLAEIDNLSTLVTEIQVGERAIVEHTRVHHHQAKATELAGLYVKQDTASQFKSNVLALGAGLLKSKILITLNGERCECDLNGISLMKGSQHVDHVTEIDHRRPGCLSRENYKGIYAESSRGAFFGTIVVQREAQKTNAFQSSRSLLLSDQARIDTRPQLKIWADDVRCTHGATVGDLDSEALFYILARGIPMPVARKMLGEAFIGEVLQSITCKQSVGLAVRRLEQLF